MSCVLANRLILNVREVNRDLELSKNTHPIEKAPGDYDFMEYYYAQAGTATMTFGNCGSLTQFELVDDARIFREEQRELEPPEADARVSSDLGDCVVPFRVL